MTDRRIELGQDAIPRLDWLLAHELVHWHAHGTRWDRLPQVVEEGLADYVAGVLVPREQAERESVLRERARHAHGWNWDALFAVTEREWSTTPTERQHAMYVVGYFLVARIGIEGLRDLCDRAERDGLVRVPIDWLLDAAEVGSSADARNAALIAWGRANDEPR